jgi:2-iminobutanoate/2-iminopropanoate deaminase
VAQTTIYLANLDDLDAVNEVYARYFTTPAPARSVVEVSRLPLGALIEMDCVACR